MATAPTFTANEVRDFLNANQGLTDADIADLMDAYGVSKETMQAATGVPLSEIESRYQAAASPEVTPTAQNFINQIDTSSGYTRTPTTVVPKKVNLYSDVEQGFIDWLSSKSDWTDKDIANYISANNVPLEFVANYTGLPYSQVLSRYTTAATTTTPGQVPTVPGVTLGQGFVRPEYTQRDFSRSRATPEVVVPTTYANRALLGPGSPGASAGVFGLPGALMPVAYPGVPAAAARPAENAAPAEGEGMKSGGLASLAQKVQSKGRYGDTVLAHISPEEAKMLERMGGAGTINPHTGLPEYWGIKSILKPFKNVAKAVAKPFAKIAPFVLPFIPGIGVPMAVGLSGLLGAYGKDGHFNLKRGLMSGLTAYGMSNLASSMAGNSLNAGAGAFDAAGAPEVLSGGTSAGASAGAGAFDMAGAPEVVNAANAMPAAAPAPVSVGTGAFDVAGAPEVLNSAAPITESSITSTANIPVDQFMAQRAADSTAAGIGNLASAGTEAVVDAAMRNPSTALFAGTQGYSAYQAKKEKDKYDAEQAKLQADYEDKRRRDREFAESVLRRYPIRFAAQGGIMAEGGIMADDNAGMDGYKAGGLKEGSFVVPADVVAHLGNGSTDAGLAALSKKYGAKPIKGAGDGMSDSIPTSIEGRQKARVANGEAVVPPEVVKKVGANRLYSMMDKVRQARTGTKKQGKQINPGKYLPA